MKQNTILGAEGRLVRGQAGGSGGDHRPQRRREEHAAQDPLAHHRARPAAGWMLTGRVGSLLEVGTGFHPELTGRENIYLNGAILGMTPSRDRAQIRRDRGLRRDRKVPRYAGQALFQRDVCAPGICRGGAPGAGDPAGG